MSNTVAVRELTTAEVLANVQTIIDISLGAFAGTPKAGTRDGTEKMFDTIRQKHLPDIFVAEVDAVMCGYALGFPFRQQELDDPHFSKFTELGAAVGDYYYSLIGVLPNYRGTGAARALFDEQLKHFSKLTGWSRTWVGNRPVTLTLPRRGFRIIKETADEVYFKREADQ